MSKTFESELDEIFDDYCFEWDEHKDCDDSCAHKGHALDFKQAILVAAEALGKRVIGKDDTMTPIQRKRLGVLTLTDANRNYLRAEQLTRLSQELGSKEQSL